MKRSRKGILFNYGASKAWLLYKEEHPIVTTEEDLYVQYVFEQAMLKLLDPNPGQRDWGQRLINEINEYKNKTKKRTKSRRP